MSRHLFGVLFFFLALEVFSDTIVMRDGTVYRGEVENQNNIKIWFRVRSGEKIEVSKSKILKVVYRDLEKGDIDKILSSQDANPPKVPELLKQNPVPNSISDPNSKLETDPFERTKDEPMSPLNYEILYNPYAPMLKSLALPFWGQNFTERKTNSFLGGIGFWIVVMATFEARAQNGEYSKALNRNFAAEQIVFAAITDPTTLTSSQQDPNFLTFGALLGTQNFLGRRERIDSEFSQINNSLNFLAILYILQAAHAYYIGVSERPNKSNSWSSKVEGFSISVNRSRFATPNSPAPSSISEFGFWGSTIVEMQYSFGF